MFKDPALQSQFDRDGYVMIDLLEADEVSKLRRFFAPYAGLHDRGFSATILTRERDYRVAAFEAVRDAAGEKLLSFFDSYTLFMAGFAVKAPNQPEAVLPLHQDMSFVDESRSTSLNLWCPLVDVGPDNGWLGMVKGSHRYNANYREPGQSVSKDLRARIEADYLTYLPMKAGQALLFHPRTLHCSPGNSTEDHRVVAVANVAPRDCPLVYCYRDWRNAPDRLEVFQVDPPFYTSYIMGTRPQGYRLLETVPRVVEPLTEALLASFAQQD